MQKRWSKAEIKYLERHAENSSLEELAKHFNTDVETIARQLTKIQVPSSSEAVIDDPALDIYDKALGLMHGGKWKQAAELFDKIAAQTGSPQLADRARQNRVVCHQRLAKEDGSQDPYLRAVYEKNEGNFDAARELCKNHGKLDKDERFAYLAASVEALAGAEEKAVSHLATAIRLEPKNRVHAFHDPDFKSLRGSEAFSELIAAPRSS